MTKETSSEVREALEAIFRDLRLEDELSRYVHDRNRYSGCYVPLIKVEDPNGLLDDRKQEDPPSRGL